VPRTGDGGWGPSAAPASSRSTATRSSPPAAGGCWSRTRGRGAGRGLVDQARHLATQARQPFPHYEHTELGYNYRLSNLLAALGRAQLRGLDSHIDRRRAINTDYRSALGDLTGLTFMPVAATGEPNWWLTCVTIDPDEFGADREQLRLALESQDIESRPTWKPLHLQPVYAGAPIVGGAVCASVFERGLCLPTGSALSPAEVQRVVDIISSLHA
jgi:dTDP-4-amino-4,6-dideoxygalactose transaminase